MAPMAASRDTNVSEQGVRTRQKTITEFGLKLFGRVPPESESSFSWKKLAFPVVLSEFYSSPNNKQQKAWCNVISIGDADYERVAAHTAVNLCSPTGTGRPRVKTIKMLDAPTIAELTLQIQKITPMLKSVVSYDGDIDMEVQPSDLGIIGLRI
jgi:hypothetical protein